ncbi:GNAT family N-acetyltransferase [Candidatus Saccharibacteria bacterium]|nr:GNAT family N-acetyltransferase [Candidatus Saccharibacteria bacterium]
MYDISVQAHANSYYDQLIPHGSMPDFIEYCRPSAPKQRIFISGINQKIDDADWFLLVAQVKQKVVGYTLARIENNSILILKGLFVHPKYQRQGIGSRLFEAYLDLVGEGMKLQLLVITSNKVAKVMYEKYGFKTIGHDVKTFFGASQDKMERTG